MSSPPPPSQALLGALGAMKPVSPRVPVRALLVVAAVGMAAGAAALAAKGLRPDLVLLPVRWLVLQLALWLLASLAPLMLALLPSAGQVLPDRARAARATVVVVVLLMGQCLLFPATETPAMVIPATWGGFFRLYRACSTFGVLTSVPMLIAGVLAVRPLAWMSSLWLGAAVGASAGALAGLVQQAHCPVGSVLHVAFAHGGSVLVGALLGALLLKIVR